ncbi:MAG: enoyl-CoA hydratase [Actinomycetota bacterium]
METLDVTRAGGVVTVTLNRPEKKNALNPAMFRELLEALAEIDDNSGDRAVVLTGAGGSFCAGADLSEKPVTGMHKLDWMRFVQKVPRALHAIRQPTIAKIRGVAVGAGANLALGCDLIVAGQDARFSQIFVQRGLSLDYGASWLLPRLVGLHRAKELALFGDVVTAEEAAAFGLVNRVVPEAELDDVVAAWAIRLAEGPPLALSMIKRLLNQSFEMSMVEALEAEATAQAVALDSRDVAAALLAFRDNRSTRFEGR